MGCPRTVHAGAVDRGRLARACPADATDASVASIRRSRVDRPLDALPAHGSRRCGGPRATRPHMSRGRLGRLDATEPRRSPDRWAARARFTPVRWTAGDSPAHVPRAPRTPSCGERCGVPGCVLSQLGIVEPPRAGLKPRSADPSVVARQPLGPVWVVGHRPRSAAGPSRRAARAADATSRIGHPGHPPPGREAAEPRSASRVAGPGSDQTYHIGRTAAAALTSRVGRARTRRGPPRRRRPPRASARRSRRRASAPKWSHPGSCGRRGPRCARCWGRR